MSTFTTRLRLIKPAAGSLNNTWGTVFNQQFSDLIDVAIAGWQTVSMTDANKTLTATNGTADESRNMMLRFTGTLTAARNVIVPPTSKLYFVENATTGGFSITVKPTSGSGVAVPNGARVLLACNGTDVVSIVDTLPVGAKIGSLTIGYLGIPQRSVSSDYTLIIEDSGHHIYHPNSDTTNRTWTIPNNTSVPFPVGTVVTFVNDENAGTVFINTQSPDVTVLAGFGSTGSRTLAPSGVCTALKTATNRWIISGTGIT
jgi:hypothetical protein